MGNPQDQATLISTDDAPAVDASGVENVQADAATALNSEPGSASTESRGHARQTGLDLSIPPGPVQRYVNRTLLGKGGMGEVVLCEDTLIGRDVALKRMHAEIQDVGGARQRFLREARVQARIEHPSVVPVYDLGASPDGGSYFTMRRIRGRTLEQILEALATGDAELARKYSRRKLLTAFVSVCLAVHYGHTRGVIHRDLKPGNIMFGDFGEVYVLDWGIAKVLEGPGTPEPEEESISVAAPTERPWGDSSGEKLTEVGQLVGTLGYMAPEQMRGREVDARADVYSLGVILYEVLSLKRMHPPSTMQELIKTVLSGGSLSAKTDELPPELDAIWRRACAVSMHERFQSAQHLADAVERFLDGDRDLEQRRKLAREHGERAEAAVHRAFTEGLQKGEATAARVEATSEVMKVLALEPGDKAARRLLARLLVEVPDEMPPEADEAVKRSVDEQRMHAIRAALLGYVSWIFCVPIAILLGVRHWPTIVTLSAMLFLATAFNLWLIRKRITATWAAVSLCGIALAIVAMSSAWLGPFVMVPTAAAITTLLFATQATARERLWFTIMGVCAAGLPFALDLLGLVPPAFAFQGGNLVLLPRAFELNPTSTLLGLIYVSISFCIVPTVYVGRMRDALSSAEKKLFLHAWQLNRLAD